MGKNRRRTTTSQPKQRKEDIVGGAIKDLSEASAVYGEEKKEAIQPDGHALGNITDRLDQVDLSLTSPESIKHAADDSIEREAEDAQPSQEINSNLVRYMQYARRYEHRRAGVTTAELQLAYDQEVLRNCKRWGDESLDEAYIQMEEASKTVATSMVISTANIASFGKMQAALEKCREDNVEIKRQTKVVERSEQNLSYAEQRLHRVIAAMFRTAGKCVELIGRYSRATDDLISESTATSSRSEAMQTKPSAPPAILDYLDRRGDKAIMFERLAELEFERQEELENREIARDRMEEIDEREEALWDANHDREYKAAARDYESAVAALNKAQEQCLAQGLNPERYHRDVYTAEYDADTDGTAVAIPLKATPVKPRVPGTLSELSSMLDRKYDTVIGPDPGDPSGMTNTTLASGPQTMQPPGSMPAKRIVNWMSDVVGTEQPRVFEHEPMVNQQEWELPLMAKEQELGDPLAIERIDSTSATPDFNFQTHTAETEYLDSSMLGRDAQSANGDHTATKIRNHTPQQLDENPDPQTTQDEAAIYDPIDLSGVEFPSLQYFDARTGAQSDQAMNTASAHQIGLTRESLPQGATIVKQVAHENSASRPRTPHSLQYATYNEAEAPADGYLHNPLAGMPMVHTSSEGVATPPTSDSVHNSSQLSLAIANAIADAKQELTNQREHDTSDSAATGTQKLTIAG